ncbi:MAG: hypothetical protein IPG72_00805 [Ardenticatenales bacterium]|nr:hypothetical protein [Ardenticatenales bacterium]
MAAEAREATMAADAKPLVPPALLLGVLAFFGGAIFLADGLGLLDARSGWAMWPVAVILLGVVVWLQPGTDSRATGIILAVAGIWLLFNAIGWWSYSFWDAWPVILILLGAWMFHRTTELRRKAGGADGYDAPTTAAEHVGAFAFLSQVHRRTTGQHLRTGEVIAIAGDCRFDFREAARGRSRSSWTCLLSPAVRRSRFRTTGWWTCGCCRCSGRRGMGGVTTARTEEMPRARRPVQGARRRLT